MVTFPKFYVLEEFLFQVFLQVVVRMQPKKEKEKGKKDFKVINQKKYSIKKL